MKDEASWIPTKFEPADGTWRGARREEFLAASSRILADAIAPVWHEALRRHAHGRLLDLGCGRVPLFGMYRQLVDDVVCIDWKASLHGVGHVDALADLNRPLPLADGSFDVIVLSDVAEHLERPDVAWAEMARLLDPGGVCLVGVPFLYGLHEEPYDFHRYTSYKLRSLFSDVGMKIEELTEAGGLPAVLATFTGKLVQHRPRLCRAFMSLASGCLRLRFVRSLSDRTRSAYPLYYLVVARAAGRG